jgi:flavodoxin
MVIFMKKNVIFYFSGTGNSYQVARDLSEHLEESEVIPIVDFKEKNITGYESVGIVFPTYFWGIPNIVKKFLEDTLVNGETYIYAVTTCGGTQGASLHQINDRLKKQGRRLDAGFRVVMPDNYILLYDAGSPEEQKVIFEQEKVRIKEIADLVRRAAARRSCGRARPGDR